MHLLDEKKSRSLEDCITILQEEKPQWAVKQIKRIYRQGRLYLKRTRIRCIASLPINEMMTTGVLLPARLQKQAAFWHIGLLQEGGLWLLFLLDYEEGTPLNVLPGEGEITEESVIQFIEKAATENGVPKKIRIPAGEPFSGRALSKWAWENRVAIHYLSMAKPENLLEAGYIKDDIKRQLRIDEITSLESLQTRSENWVQSFAQKESEAVNYFAKETVV